MSDSFEKTKKKKAKTRIGPLRIEAARVNVRASLDLGRAPDPRILEIAETPINGESFKAKEYKPRALAR